ITISRNFGAFGGGIFNQGTLTISNTTISENGDDDGGGGIANSGTLTMSNSTISHNRSLPYYPGGGIENSGTATISSSTISRNEARYGGGIFNRGTLHMRDTILAGNAALDSPDLDGRLTSSSYNLIGNREGGDGYDKTDLLDVDPLLGPLADNGGP